LKTAYANRPGRGLHYGFISVSQLRSLVAEAGWVVVVYASLNQYVQSKVVEGLWYVGSWLLQGRVLGCLTVELGDAGLVFLVLPEALDLRICFAFVGWQFLSLDGKIVHGYILIVARAAGTVDGYVITPWELSIGGQLIQWRMAGEASHTMFFVGYFCRSDG